MKYGQHETFHLRLNWMRKGIKMINSYPGFFFEKDAAEKIGLGKNMVQSLRFWITATNIAVETKDSSNKSIHKLTNLGEIINEYDPYLDFPDSLSLLHYSLIKRDIKKDRLYVWHGFFNEISRGAVTKDEIVTEIATWAANEGENASEKSLKRDVDCLVRLYLKETNKKDPEDVTQSLLGKLALLTTSSENSNLIIKNHMNHKSVGLLALMYIMLKFGESNNTDNISVEEIETKADLWGKLFNMQRSEIVNALEKLSEHVSYPIQFIRTNRLDTIRLPAVLADEFLKSEYQRKVGDYLGDRNKAI